MQFKTAQSFEKVREQRQYIITWRIFYAEYLSHKSASRKVPILPVRPSTNYCAINYFTCFDGSLIFENELVARTFNTTNTCVNGRCGFEEAREQRQYIINVQN